MQLIAKPIEVILYVNRHGEPKPLRFRYTDTDGEEQTVVVEDILKIEEKSIPGAKAFLYTCQSEKNGNKYRYTLKLQCDHELMEWQLYEI